ncbi:class I SAM-dependent methyltransferase [Methylobacterium sp. P31]
MIDATGERYVPKKMRGLIENEHLHRYSAARRLCEGQIVLDIASGEGYGSYLLSQVAKQVIGVDIDFRSVQHGRSIYSNRRENVQYLNASADHLPFRSKSFDTIISFETIEHIRDHNAVIKECARVLKCDGVFLISTPNRKCYSEAPAYNNLYHIKEFDREEFKHLLKNYFSCVDIYQQSIICPSMIKPEKMLGGDAVAIEAGEGADIIPFEFAEFQPTYYLALCSNAPQLTPILTQSLFLNKNWIDLHSMTIELENLRKLKIALDFQRPVQRINLCLDEVLYDFGFKGHVDERLLFRLS